MKKHVLIISLFSILLAACGGSDVAPAATAAFVADVQETPAETVPGAVNEESAPGPDATAASVPDIQETPAEIVPGAVNEESAPGPAATAASVADVQEAPAETVPSAVDEENVPDAAATAPANSIETSGPETIDLASLQGKYGSGWNWSSYGSETGASFEVENPQQYALIFDDASSMVVISDCNFAAPTYTLDGSQLAIEMDLGELDACADGSRSEQLLELLANADSAALEGDALHIDVQQGAGTLVFDPIDRQAPLRVGGWDEAAQKLLQSCKAPGGVLLVDGPAGRFLQAYGVASAEENTPMKSGDRFEIGSNTKSFTVVLALQLQEEGVWSLDDPLSSWLPDEAARIPNGDQITLRQLASNTSGVWDYADPLITAALKTDNLEQGYTPDELVDFIVERGKPSFAPGEGAAYSSSNFLLLGQAIEAATGESIADLYQERIFDPLGMDSSSLLEGVPEDGAIVNGYYTDDSGMTLNTTNENGSQMWAAGGIISTAEDMAKYTAALPTGALYKDQDSLTQMTDFGDDFVASFAGYGLGVGIWSNEPFAWGHGGQTAGFQTLFAIFPTSETNVVLLTNSANCSVAGLMAYVQASPDLLAE